MISWGLIFIQIALVPEILRIKSPDSPTEIANIQFFLCYLKVSGMFQVYFTQKIVTSKNLLLLTPGTVSDSFSPFFHFHYQACCLYPFQVGVRSTATYKHRSATTSSPTRGAAWKGRVSIKVAGNITPISVLGREMWSAFMFIFRNLNCSRVICCLKHRNNRWGVVLTFEHRDLGSSKAKNKACVSSFLGGIFFATCYAGNKIIYFWPKKLWTFRLLGQTWKDFSLNVSS